MLEKILAPFLVALVLAGGSLSPAGPDDPQRRRKGGGRGPTFERRSITEVKRPMAAQAAAEQMTLREKQELAEGFRVAYNLAAAPDLVAIDAIELSIPRYGASAKGVVVKEKEGELYLDTTPCEPEVRKKQMYTFNSPYRKDDADEITCPKSSVKYKMTKVTQRARRPLGP